MIQKSFIVPLVLCSNVKVLMECVKRNRQIENVHLKFGIDNGGGFLEVYL